MTIFCSRISFHVLGDFLKRILLLDKILLQGGVINTSTENAGGGNLALTISKRLYLQKGKVTTSVRGGTGDGGNLKIGAPDFVILANGRIVAQADEGHGGNIRIIAEQFIKSIDSLVSASSRLGLDGKVEIESPDENVSEGMLALAAEHIDASSLMKKRCEAMSYEEYQNRHRLVVFPIMGSPPSPFDLLPSQLVSFSKFTQTEPSILSLPSIQKIKPHQLAFLTECRALSFQREIQIDRKNSRMPVSLF